MKNVRELYPFKRKPYKMVKYTQTMYKTAKSLSLIRLGFLRVTFPGGEVNWIPLLFQEDLGPAHMEVSWPAWAG